MHKAPLQSRDERDKEQIAVWGESHRDVTEVDWLPSSDGGRSTHCDCAGFIHVGVVVVAVVTGVAILRAGAERHTSTAEIEWEDMK